MSNNAITHLRNTLAAFVQEKAGALSTRDLVTAFSATHAKAVKAASGPLLTIALTKLVDDVSRRRVRAQRSGQHDLFYGFSLPRAIMVDVMEDGASRRRRLTPLNTPCELVAAYLKRQPKVQRRTRDVGLEDAYARAHPFITSPSMTLGEALAAAEAAAQDGAAAP